jgi:prenylcysteine alpha-carboxyl methylesterase
MKSSIRQFVIWFSPLPKTEKCSFFCSKTFTDALQAAEVKAELVMYKGKTHTDLFLQDPLRGGKDELFDHIVSMIHADDSDALRNDAVAPPRKRLVPEFLLKLAGRVSPF